MLLLLPRITTPLQATRTNDESSIDSILVLKDPILRDLVIRNGFLEFVNLGQNILPYFGSGSDS